MSHTGTLLSDCQQEYQESEILNFALGQFVPRCSKDGGYEPVQCLGSECYCVNENGDEIHNTRTRLPNKPNCTLAGKYFLFFLQVFQVLWCLGVQK